MATARYRSGLLLPFKFFVQSDRADDFPTPCQAAECVEGDPGLPTKRGQRGAPAARGLLSLVTFFAEAKKVTHPPG